MLHLGYVQLMTLLCLMWPQPGMPVAARAVSNND